MNDLAHEAGVGVGTVYRHFPSHRALTEALTSDTLDRMLAVARDAVGADDASDAFITLVRKALDLQLDDGGLQAVIVTDDDESDDVRKTKHEIYAAFRAVLQRAQADGAIRADMTVVEMQHLICGIEHAVRLGDARGRGLYIDVLIAGLRA